MRILALCPHPQDMICGNVITLRRIRSAMELRGHSMRILEVSPETEEAELRDAAREVDLLHFYHAFKSGRFLPKFVDRPTVLTLSGTDINQDWEDSGRRRTVEAAIASARVLTTYNPSMARRLRAEIPALEVTVIPKGVTIGDGAFDLRTEAGVGREAILFFHPGGVRPVKNNLAAVDAVAETDASLVFAGPILDEDYGEEFLRRLGDRIRHLPAIPHEGMAAAYRAADVVLNTSLSEGLSNALIEAMTHGRAILASDIPGNRDLVLDGETGLLYRDRGDLIAKARRLIADPALRRTLGSRAEEHARDRFSTDREVDALLIAYRRAQI